MRNANMNKQRLSDSDFYNEVIQATSNLEGILDEIEVIPPNTPNARRTSGNQQMKLFASFLSEITDVRRTVRRNEKVVFIRDTPNFYDTKPYIVNNKYGEQIGYLKQEHAHIIDQLKDNSLAEAEGIVSFIESMKDDITVKIFLRGNPQNELKALSLLHSNGVSFDIPISENDSLSMPQEPFFQLEKDLFAPAQQESTFMEHESLLQFEKNSFAPGPRESSFTEQELFFQQQKDPFAAAQQESYFMKQGLSFQLEKGLFASRPQESSFTKQEPFFKFEKDSFAHTPQELSFKEHESIFHHEKDSYVSTLQKPPFMTQEHYFKEEDLFEDLYNSPNVISSRTIITPEQMQNELDSLFETLDEGDKTTEAETAQAIVTRLYPHQKQALNWMIMRENSNLLPPFWEKKDNIYYNTLTNEICEDRPESVHGGILADDMGLGKTLQMISLIMTNSWNGQLLVNTRPGKQTEPKKKQSKLSEFFPKFVVPKRKVQTGEMSGNSSKVVNVESSSQKCPQQEQHVKQECSETGFHCGKPLTSPRRSPKREFYAENDNDNQCEKRPKVDKGKGIGKMSNIMMVKKELLDDDDDFCKLACEDFMDTSVSAIQPTVISGQSENSGLTVDSTQGRCTPESPNILLAVDKPCFVSLSETSGSSNDSDQQASPSILQSEDYSLCDEIHDKTFKPVTGSSRQKNMQYITTDDGCIVILDDPVDDLLDIESPSKLLDGPSSSELPDILSTRKLTDTLSTPGFPDAPLTPKLTDTPSTSKFSDTPLSLKLPDTPSTSDYIEISDDEDDLPDIPPMASHINIVSDDEDDLPDIPPVASLDFLLIFKPEGLKDTMPNLMTEKQRLSNFDSETDVTGCQHPRGNLIICPVSVMDNWMMQFEQHVDKSVHVRIHQYYGQNRCKDIDFLKQKDVIITTYSTLTSDLKSKNGEKSPLHEILWLRIILDEGHQIRNPRTQQSHAIFQLRAERRWVLTGTPIQNSLQDLWSLLKFLDVKPFTDIGVWNKTVAMPMKMRQQSALQRVAHLMKNLALRRSKTQQVNGKPLVELPAKDVYLEKIKLDDEEREVYNAMQKEGKIIINKYFRRGTLLHQYSQVFAILLRLRQLCCHPQLLSKAVKMSRKDASEPVQDNEDVSNETSEGSEENQQISNEEMQRRIEELKLLLREGSDEECSICLESYKNVVITQCAHPFCRACIEGVIEKHKSESRCPICRHKIEKDMLIDVHFGIKDVEEEEEEAIMSPENWQSSAKVDALMKALSDLRKSNPNVKSIVVSQFTSFLTLIEIPLRRDNFVFTRLDGKMSAGERSRAIRKFSDPSPGAPMIMLLSLKAGGVGINLTAASRLFLMDPAWNPAAEDQCFDRCHRLGQTKDVVITKFVIEDSVEERMIDLQEKKRHLMRSAFDKKLTQKQRRDNLIKQIQSLFNL